MMQKERADVANSIKEYAKRFPRLYYFVFDMFGPVYFGGVGPKQFLTQYPSDGLVINIGSGARRIAPGIVNIDITKYDAVDVVADAAHLPFADRSVSRIICDQVLEHVADPHAVVREMERVLTEDGYVYISTPFMYPFHASPSDHYRWTLNGYRKLLAAFRWVDGGVRSGPCSAFTVMVSYFLATVLSLGSTRLYWVLVYTFSLLLFPIRYLDIIGNRLPFAHHMAAVLYGIVRK